MKSWEFTDIKKGPGEAKTAGWNLVDFRLVEFKLGMGFQRETRISISIFYGKSMVEQGTGNRVYKVQSIEATCKSLILVEVVVLVLEAASAEARCGATVTGLSASVPRFNVSISYR